MVLLGYAQGVATTAGSYAFSAGALSHPNLASRPSLLSRLRERRASPAWTLTFTRSAASSYMFRSDASTSSATARGASPSSNSKSASTQPSPPSSPASRRLSLRRSPSQSRLPSASHPYLNGTASSSANRAIPETDESDRPPRGEAEDLVDELNCEDELYAILGVAKRAKTEEIRRAFLARSRVIHPE